MIAIDRVEHQSLLHVRANESMSGRPGSGELLESGRVLSFISTIDFSAWPFSSGAFNEMFGNHGLTLRVTRHSTSWTGVIAVSGRFGLESLLKNWETAPKAIEVSHVPVGRVPFAHGMATIEGIAYRGKPSGGGRIPTKAERHLSFQAIYNPDGSLVEDIDALMDDVVDAMKVGGTERFSGHRVSFSISGSNGAGMPAEVKWISLDSILVLGAVFRDAQIGLTEVRSKRPVNPR